MQRHYDNHKSYQRPFEPVDSAIAKDLHDVNRFCDHLADEKRYGDYLAYFEEEIDERGYPSVINEYLFGGISAQMPSW